MKSLPIHVKPYKRTPIFDQDSIPDGLRKNHSTKSNVWGLITIIKGELEYHITQDEHELILLDESQPGVVEPEVKHFIKPVGDVQLYVEFYKYPVVRKCPSAKARVL